MIKRILFLIFFCSVTLSLTFGNPVKREIQSGKFEREYLLYTPNNPKYDKPEGLIVCLHGFNRTMNDFFNDYNLSETADSLNFIIVAPQALPEQEKDVIDAANTIKVTTGYDIPLNSVWGCGLRVKADMKLLGIYITLLNEVLNKNIDDVSFIESIINKTIDEYSMKHENVFIFGTSMGGYMSYQFAAKKGDKLSGLISAAGSMGLAIQGTENNLKVPVCDFHSITDEVVPYSGILNKYGLRISLAKSKKEVLNHWTKVNNTLEPVSEDIHYYPSTNEISVKKITYPDPIYEVIHYKIDGADHSYFFRKENGDCMDHREEIVKFINAHSTKDQTGISNIQSQNLAIYPNPAKDIIYVNIPEGAATIYNYNGKICLQQKFQSGQIDVSALNNGIYFIQIQTVQTKQSSKIIINR